MMTTIAAHTPISTPAKKPDKRTRLVLAADELFHKQGISSTTLANIATLADVPLGNVYYYFKSKESIILAVVEYRRKSMQRAFDELNTLSHAKDRLIAFVERTVQDNELISQYGDPIGSLCQELGKQDSTQIAESTHHLMQDLIKWCAAQFSLLGKDDDKSESLAASLIAGLQGISLLTLSFSAPDFARTQCATLTRWIEQTVIA